MSYTATLMAVLNVVDAFYPKVPVGPTDEGLSALLRKYKKLGVTTMGLTARRPALAEATWCQMGDRCNFEWNYHPLVEVASLEGEMRCKEHVEDPDVWDGLSFERGVWFTSNANKGSLMAKVIKPGMHIVFADDSHRHLVAAQNALRGHAASLACLHFTAATSAAKEKLNATNCDAQLSQHVAELFKEGNPLVAGLVKSREPFLARFMEEQQGTPLSDTELQAACLCGSISWHLPDGRNDVGQVLVCHCTMCQKSSGSSCIPYVALPKKKLWKQLHSGSDDASCVTRYDSTVVNGAPVATRGFCKQCGSNIYMDYGEDFTLWMPLGTISRFDPDLLAVASEAASTEDKARDSHIFHENRAIWADTLRTGPMPRLAVFGTYRPDPCQPKPFTELKHWTETAAAVGCLEK